MKTIESLIKEKNLLPKGKIYKKKINGKIYYYHQYTFNNGRYSKLLKNEEVNDLQIQIDRRLEIEKEIKKLIANGKRNINLSSNATNLTGYLMKEDEVVAEFEDGNLIYINEKTCPLMIKRTRRLEPFLKTRVIDSGRTNSRLLKKALNIKEKEDYLVSLCSYGAAITDTYWFKPKFSKLKYKDVSFDNDMFFDLSLKGLISIYPNKIVLTPELTTNGSYEKGWKFIDNEWWLYKVGTKEEIFSELFYSHLFELLGLPTAHYEFDEGYIRSKNFAHGYIFEPIISLADEDDSYENIFQILNELDSKIACDYLRLCYFDVILNNVDRHNENCGLLRDKKSGKILSFAPNYDDNLSLISRNKNLVFDLNEGFLKQFLNLIKRNTSIKEALKKQNIPLITIEILNKCYDDLSFRIEINKNELFDYILNRQKALIKEINK